MSGKLISDIRLFETDVPNTDGNPEPHYIGRIYEYDDMSCLDVIQRLLFLLRHRGFGFDGFDHLYLSVTPCIPHGEVRDVNRYNIREFSWYHYVDVGCDTELFCRMTLEEKNGFILDAIKKAAMLKASVEKQPLFSNTFDEVISMGEALLIPYKRKENQNYTVEIFTRIDDEVSFIPLVRVTDAEGIIKAERELAACGRDEFISMFGTVTIGRASVRITPRKNQTAKFYDLNPIKIEW